MTNHQYFIHVFNIIHKLLDALVASRLTLLQKAKLSKILIWLLFGVCFWKKKGKKKQLKCWTIVLDLLNYISICHCNNLQTNIVHPNLNIFSLEPTTRPSPILKFSFCSSLTTSHYVLPIHTITRRGSWGFIKTKSPFLKSLNGVYTKKNFKILWPTIRMHDRVFCIINFHLGWQWSPNIIRFPVAWRPKTLQKCQTLRR